MAITKKPQPKSAAGEAGGMAQRRRWLVFGSNVAVTILLATALLAVVIWLSTAILGGRTRADWTATGRFSISPRTKALLGELDALDIDVRLTNLYSHTPEIPASEDQWRRVRDLLTEYDVASGRVEVEDINPALDVGGVEELIRRLTERYAGELRKPKRLIDEFNALDEDVRKHLAAEAKNLDDAADAWKGGPPDAGETLRMVAEVWRQLMMIGDVAADNIRGLSEQALPAYSDALNQARAYLKQVRERFTVVPEALKRVEQQAGDAAMPDAVRQLIAQAEEAYAPLRGRIEAFEKDATVDETELDRVRRDINRGETVLIETYAPRGVILTPEADAGRVEQAASPAGALTVLPPAKGEGQEVLTPPDALEAVKKALQDSGLEVASAEVQRRPGKIHVVSFDDVWVRNPSAYEDPEAPERLFAGEQALSSALLGMVHAKKPTLLFVTSGGPAVTPMPTNPMMGGGMPAPYGEMAERLRRANFIVEDWDVQRSPELPAIEDASDKIVLVLVPPQQPDTRMPMPPPDPAAYGPAIDLVRQGAPAIIMGEPTTMFQQPVPYTDLFTLFGVEAKLNAVAVHSVVVDAAGTEQALPQILITAYANHEITRPVGALPSMVFGGAPLVTQDKAPEGVTVRPLVEMPGGADYWADTVAFEAMQRRATFDGAEDLRGPLPLAVAATRKVGDQDQKVVLFGDSDFAKDFVAFNREAVMYRDHIEMQDRFPGNAEVFVNACLWVSGGEQLIAVSPEALEARRIGDLGAWQLPIQIFLVVGLPVLVLAAGILVYVVRRK